MIDMGTITKEMDIPLKIFFQSENNNSLVDCLLFLISIYKHTRDDNLKNSIEERVNEYTRTHIHIDSIPGRDSLTFEFIETKMTSYYVIHAYEREVIESE